MVEGLVSERKRFASLKEHLRMCNDGVFSETAFNCSKIAMVEFGGGAGGAGIEPPRGLLKGPIDSAIYAENWDRFAVRGDRKSVV